jgi:hypothetical protein
MMDRTFKAPKCSTRTLLHTARIRARTKVECLDKNNGYSGTAPRHCRSVFLAEVLAKGEVPRDARSIWKQRSRWAAAAHMYILDPSSVFWRPQKNMTYWQKSLYWIPMVLHWTLIWAEPVMFSMPIMCLYGMCRFISALQPVHLCYSRLQPVK